MYCPKCGIDSFKLIGSCPRCHFSGETALLEEWIGLDFLLKELVNWHDIPETFREGLRNKYGLRRRDVEVQLGVRQPPLDQKAAEEARQELTDLRSFTYSALIQWVRQGWLTSASATKLRQECNERIEQLQALLINGPPQAAKPVTSYDLARRRQLLYQLHLLDILKEKNRLAGLTVYDEAKAKITAELHPIEISLGLRQPPRPAPEPARPAAALRPAQPPRKAPTAAKPPAPPPKPREPITWDRIWETLLSERTVRAILFLGATLLFAAAVSLVIWNWGTFSPWLQVAFLASFTAVFYGLGWYVRTRMQLKASGLALAGVASLLVPIDFYALYLSGGIFGGLPWNYFWLLTSAVCFWVYLLTVYLIQAEFFGYLVGVAAGSLLAASLRLLGVGSDWLPMEMAGLSLGLGLTAAFISSVDLKLMRRWRTLATPFWHLSVLGATAVLAVGSGYGMVGLAGGSSFTTSLAISWWLGGAAYLLAVRHFQMRSVALAAAACFPIAAFLTQRQLYGSLGISAAWYGLGWALLVPLYLLVGQRLQVWAGMESNEERAGLLKSYSQTALVGWTLLVFLAFIWSLLDAGAMGASHLILALTMVLAARLWERPNYLPIASLFLMSGTAGLGSIMGGAIGQLGLGWALLAVGHIAAAIRLSNPAVDKNGKPKSTGNRALYAKPIFRAGWAIAGLALLPPLLTQERPILTYVLGNWIAINGWLAMLAHEGRLSLAQFWPLIRGRQLVPSGTPLFHWIAALSLPLWVWLAWTNGRAGGTRMGLAFLALGWLALILGARLRRMKWGYGRPWFVAGHISVIVAMIVSPFRFDQPVAAVLFLLTSAFYVFSSRIIRNRWQLVPAAIAFPIGAALALDWLSLPPDPLMFVMALIVLGYIVGSQRASLSERYQTPLVGVAYALGTGLFLASLFRVMLFERTDALLLWQAATQAALAVAVGLHAWSIYEEGFAHIAAWLSVISGGLIASAFSQGRGSSAVKAALLAMLYIAIERLLHRAALKKGWRWRLRAAEMWELFRQPLLTAGWGVSFITIFLALFRNLVLLGGGPARESWAIAGLLLITGFYLASAWIYRHNPRMSGRRVWWAAGLVFFPWTLLTHMGWYLWDAPMPPSRYAISWAILALGLLGVGALLTAPAVDRRWTRPPKIVAYWLMPFALVWGVGNSATSSVTVGLAIVFYLLALYADRLSQLRKVRVLKLPIIPVPKSRFLYPAAFLVPIWGIYLLDYFLPSATRLTYGLLLLTFSLPFLLLAQWVARREPSFKWPLYLVAYGTAVIGTYLVIHNRPILIGALVFDAFLGILSARFHKRPFWLYAAVGALPIAWLLTLAEWNVPANRFGWGLLMLSQIFLIVAWLLAYWKRNGKERLAQPVTSMALPFLVGVFWLICLSVPLSTQDRLGVQIGYSAAVFLLAQLAVWLRQPILSAVAAGLITIPYWLTMFDLGIGWTNYGLGLWPLIATYLLLGYGLDKLVGKKPLADLSDDKYGVMEPFPWYSPDKWPGAALGRLLHWWGLPFYVIAFGGVFLAVLLSILEPGRLTVTLLMAAAVFGWATAYFRVRVWLLATIGALQLAVLAGLEWAGWGNGWNERALLFMPVTLLTAFIGIVVEWGLEEEPFLNETGQIRLGGWSRPFFMMLAFDMLLGQLISVNFGVAFIVEGANIAITLAHVFLIVCLALWWKTELLSAFSAILGFVGLVQYLFFVDAPLVNWPTAMALLTVVYGLFAYELRFLRTRGVSWMALPEIKIWERPFYAGGWALSVLSWLAMLSGSLRVVGLAFVALFERPHLTANNVSQVQMVVGVLALLGLFYLAVAVVDRVPKLGYFALGMMLTAWSLEWALVWGQREVQYYAIPAGCYLLLIGYMEWQNGNRSLARWIDRAALVLLLGTSFWQSLGPQGWAYALLMGFEGLMIVWWGSTRRLRHFLYAGVVGVTVDVIGQFGQPLLTATDRWIVFGITGIILITLAILVERRMENVLALTKHMRQRLENWD